MYACTKFTTQLDPRSSPENGRGIAGSEETGIPFGVF